MTNAIRLDYRCCGGIHKITSRQLSILPAEIAFPVFHPCCLLRIQPKTFYKAHKHFKNNSLRPLFTVLSTLTSPYICRYLETNYYNYSIRKYKPKLKPS